MSAPTGKELEQAREQAQKVIQDLRSRKETLDKDSIDLILREARSHYAWDTSRPISHELIETIYDITANGPTSMNSCPARFFIVKSIEAKQRLAKALKEKNIDKMMSAPVTIILAYDSEFWKELPFLFPHEDRRPLFQNKPEYAEKTAFLNATLQGAYFMIAARAMGLDVGAMSGFSNDIVDQEFFAGSTLKSDFLINMGYADEKALFQKLPRFPFDKACTYL